MSQIFFKPPDEDYSFSLRKWLEAITRFFTMDNAIRWQSVDKSSFQGISGSDITNNVTAGGTNNQIDNFTDLTTYSNSAATIRNDIHQLARSVKIINDTLRDYGMLS